MGELENNDKFEKVLLSIKLMMNYKLHTYNKESDKLEYPPQFTSRSINQNL